MFTSKKKTGLSAIEQKAKMKVLKDIHGKMEGILGGNLKGAQKVTVAADSKEGLKAGLDKAEDILGEQEDEECSYCEGSGCPHCAVGDKQKAQLDDAEEVQDSAEPMDEDELDAKIQELMAMKAKLEKK